RSSSSRSSAASSPARHGRNPAPAGPDRGSRGKSVRFPVEAGAGAGAGGLPAGDSAPARDVAHEVDAAVAVSPLVVVPGDQLEEPAVEADAASGVEDRAVAVVDEVRRHDLVARPAEDPL